MLIITVNLKKQNKKKKLILKSCRWREGGINRWQLTVVIFFILKQGVKTLLDDDSVINKIN